MISAASSPPRRPPSRSTAIRLWRRTLLESDFTIEDLVNHERPMSFYLVVPPSDKIRLSPAYPLDVYHDREPAY